MAVIEMVDKAPQRRGRNDHVRAVIDALREAAPWQVLKVTEFGESPRSFYVKLKYYRDRRGRPGPPHIPGMQIMQRDGVVYCWKEE